MILRVRAPFAAFRPFQAGTYRSTLPVITPTAAYGLVLNLAGIDTREGAPRAVDVPTLRLAVGAFTASHVGSMFQQLHSYLVGSSGKELAGRTHGAKYWIAPARREVLIDLDAAIAVDTDPHLEERVLKGLQGALGIPRYGLPFAGDNNFLLDRIDVCDGVPAHWYAKLDVSARPGRGTVRLPMRIHRDDQSKTELGIFAPGATATSVPPDAAWVSVGE